jgi:hypothetical protein
MTDADRDRLAAPVVLIYGAMLATGLVVYTASGIGHAGPSLWVGAILGTGIGYIVALCNFRLLIAMGIFAGIAMVCSPLMPAELAGSHLWKAFLPAAICAYASLSDRWALAAFWFPTVIWMLSILDRGHGHGTPDDVGLAMLAVLAALFVVFLRARESRRVGLWRVVASRPLATGARSSMLEEAPGRPLLRAGWGLAVTAIAFAFTGWVAPKLWGLESFSDTKITQGRGHGKPCCPTKLPVVETRSRIGEYFDDGRTEIVAREELEEQRDCMVCKDDVADASEAAASDPWGTTETIIGGGLDLQFDNGYGYWAESGTGAGHRSYGQASGAGGTGPAVGGTTSGTSSDSSASGDPWDSTSTGSTPSTSGKPSVSSNSPTPKAPSVDPAVTQTPAPPVEPTPQVASPPTPDPTPPIVDPAPTPVPSSPPPVVDDPPPIPPAATPPAPDSPAVTPIDPIPNQLPPATGQHQPASERPAPATFDKDTSLGSWFHWLTFLVIGALAYQGIGLALRPLRRALTLRHLRRPFWDETIDQRISNAWQLALVGLRDAGWRAVATESPTELARRVHVDGLDRCATILDRARYGVEVPASDVAEMSAAADAVYHAARKPLGPFARIAASLRRPLA